MRSRFNMAGPPTDKAALGIRLRSIREEIYGDDGDCALAEQLGLPPGTWLNYERGVTIPGEVILRYLTLTKVEPLWLLEGQGAKYRMTPSSSIDSSVNPKELISTSSTVSISSPRESGRPVPSVGVSSTQSSP